jgi:hypothetical protein
MTGKYLRHSALLFAFLIINIRSDYAGPPFNTDDPEPVNYRHWEYYVSAVNNHHNEVWSGTSPHLEINYGVIHNVQIHLLLPMNYYSPRDQRATFGFADTEFGIKYRFVQETENSPQVGIFPILEIPTIHNSEFSDGKLKVFLPVWLQKSWGKLTSYGGAGYWINSGTNNKNWIFAGWQIQYDFSRTITLGGEIYYHSADADNSDSATGFNLGGSINPSEKFHIIFSAGKTLAKDNTFTSYLGLLWTI